MGRQIRFFITKQDERDLLENIIDNKLVILDRKSTRLTLDEALISKELKFFIALPESEIVISSSGFIDPVVTEVIDFKRCRKQDEKILWEGRLWVELRYYDNTQQMTTKPKILEDTYNKYVRWVKKNFKPSKCKDYYIGKDAYQKYKKEDYIMKAGPKYVVEFE